MKKLKTVFICFVCATTGSVFVAAAFMTFFWKVPTILWQILGVSAMCGLSTLVFPDHDVTKRKSVVLTIVHYFIINVIVLGGGFVFGWYDIRDISMVVTMIVSVAVIYTLISLLLWRRAKNEANRMNEKLLEYQSNSVAKNAEEN